MLQLDVGLLVNMETERLMQSLFLSENHALYREMTVYGAAYGVRIGIFGMKDLQLEGDKMRGKAAVFTEGKFEIAQAYLPELLESSYYIVPQTMTMFPKEVVDWLIGKKVSKPLPTKAKLPQLLIGGGAGELVIPTVVAQSYEAVCQNVMMLKHCVVKPDNGKRGWGVMYADYENGRITYETPEEAGELTSEVWQERLQKYPHYRRYLVQPRLNFHDKTGQAVDFRLLVAKGLSGDWEIVDIYVRAGHSKIISNLSAGGFVGEAKAFLESDYDDTEHKLFYRLQQIALQVPKAVETVLAQEAESCYGIDVGIDLDTMEMFVIEVNSFPGAAFHKYALAQKRVQYYRYLLDQA